MGVAVGDVFVQARVIRTRKSTVQEVIRLPLFAALEELPRVVAILQEERATCVPRASRGVSAASSRLAYGFNRIRRGNDRQFPGRA